MSSVTSASNVREQWIINDEPRWKEMLAESGINAEYAEQVLKDNHLATISFGVPQALPLKERKVEILSSPILLSDDGVTSVYMPSNARVPHNLSVVLNRSVKGITEVTDEEAVALRMTLNKVRAIMKEEFGLSFAVEATFTIPYSDQLRDKFSIDVIPSLKENKDELSNVDKIDCIAQVLFRGIFDYSQPTLTEDVRQNQVIAWKELLSTRDFRPFNSSTESELIPVWKQVQKDRIRAQEILLDRVHQLATTKGIEIERVSLPFDEVDADRVESEKKTCPFCMEKVITAQKVHETALSYLIYNSKPASEMHFLILPKRNVRYLESLTEAEVIDMHQIARKLSGIIAKQAGTSDIKMYVQDGPSVGQTVAHEHMHLLLTPDPLRHTLFSINYDKEKTLDQSQIAKITESIRLQMAQ